MIHPHGARITASHSRRTPQNTHLSFRTAFRRRSLAVRAYHDEIKPERKRTPFLAHGILLVPDDWKYQLVDEMLASRKRHLYYDEIHYRNVKQGGVQDHHFLVAKDWVQIYFSRFVRGCSFKAFIVDYDNGQHFPFPGDAGYPAHLEKSIQASVLGSLAWSFPKESQVRLTLVSDATDNELEREVLQNTPAAVNARWNRRRAAGRKGPWLQVSDGGLVSSDPKAVRDDQRIDSEMVQLCDLLLGACFDALSLLGEPSKNGRRMLSKSALGVISETVKVPWLQQVPVHRRFSVSLYPDANHMAYPAALRLARRSCDASARGFPDF